MDAGFRSVREVAMANFEELTSIPGIGEKIALKIFDSCSENADWIEAKIAERDAQEAERLAQEAAERERLEAAERERLEAAERERLEAAERERQEAAERELQEAAERDRLAQEEIERQAAEEDARRAAEAAGGGNGVEPPGDSADEGTERVSGVASADAHNDDAVEKQ
jgi:membrane protein involved in colicin uptake